VYKECHCFLWWSTGTFGISDVMMVGDKRKFNTALITLTAEGHTGELAGNGKLIGDALKVHHGIGSCPWCTTDRNLMPHFVYPR
jgi:hypothetical protein